jgi:hypothetical protein
MRRNDKMTKQQQSSLLSQVLKVLYAPHKAFKEIIESPKFMGPILILILFIAANIGLSYVLMSKTYVEGTLPQTGELDVWTENATLWSSTSGASITENFNDYMNGTYYGNRSISFSMLNSRQVSMELFNIGPINCSGLDDYKNASLRIKLVSPSVRPESASIYLFSQGPSSYFSYNLTDTFSNSASTVWNNLTLPLANDQWASNNGPSWGTITGLELDFAWPENSNITVLVDALFFRGVFTTPLDTAALSYVMNYSVISLMQFAVEWLFLAGIIYVMIRAFGTKTTWRPVLIVVGFALIVLFVQTVINAIAIATLPRLYYPLEFIGGVQAERDIAVNMIYDATTLVSVVSGYLRIIVFVWTIALCGVGTRLLTEFSWVKSFLISAVAFFATTTLMSFIIGI